jgi:hypothetical protein
VRPNIIISIALLFYTFNLVFQRERESVCELYVKIQTRAIIDEARVEER